MICQQRRKFFDAIVEDAVHPERDIYVAESESEKLGAALWLKPGQKAHLFVTAVTRGRFFYRSTLDEGKAFRGYIVVY